MAFDSERSSAPGLTSSQAGGHITPISCSSNCRLKNLSNQSQSQIYVTTNGQSPSLSWNKAPVWGLRLDFLLPSESYGFVDVGRPL
jgi:hypothetical protein